MTPFLTGLKIWGIAVLLNAVYFGFFSLVTGEFFNVLLSLLILFAGAFVGLPFLVLLVQLLKITRRLPYGRTACIAWLSFVTAFGVWLFYSVVLYVIGETPVLHSSFLWQVSGITIAAFLTSMWFCRKSLYKMDGMDKLSIN